MATGLETTGAVELDVPFTLGFEASRAARFGREDVGIGGGRVVFPTGTEGLAPGRGGLSLVVLLEPNPIVRAEGRGLGGGNGSLWGNVDCVTVARVFASVVEDEAKRPGNRGGGGVVPS